MLLHVSRHVGQVSGKIDLIVLHSWKKIEGINHSHYYSKKKKTTSKQKEKQQTKYNDKFFFIHWFVHKEQAKNIIVV